MSGSNNNVSGCLVLESERVLKLSNVLTLYNRQDYLRKDRASLMEFISTFENKGDDIDCAEKTDFTHYIH